MKRFLLTLLPLIVVAPASANSASSVAIDHPADGAIVSAGAGQLPAGGSVVFEEPEKGTRRFYLRTESCSGTAIVGRKLSILNPGTDTTSPCSPVTHVAPTNEVTRSAEVYEAWDGVPTVLDGSRPVTGVLTMSSLPVGPAYAGVGTTTIDVRLESWGGNPGSLQDIGSTSVTYTVAATDGPRQLEWSMMPRSVFDKQDITYLRLLVTVRGAKAGHGFTVYNGASHMTLPTWSASFVRKVEVALDDPLGAWTSGSVSQDLGEWQATLPEPEPGDHTLYVRAVQGRADWGSAKYSEVASASFRVG